MGSTRSRYALILAAGKGTRFKSEKPKVLHEICGKPMICYLLDRLPELQVEKAIIVVGQGAEEVQNALQGYPVEFVRQEQQLGTGHAVMSAVPALNGLDGNLIVLYGDTPLIQTSALEELFVKQETTGADEVLLTVQLDNPTGYGRILRDSAGQIFDIIEEKETTEEQRRILEVNAGFVCFGIKALVGTISQLSNENVAGEYYLTDMVKVLRRNGRSVETVQVEAADEEIFGINDRRQLAAAAVKLRSRINTRWMEEGVTLIDPNSTVIDSTVEIGPDTMIHPGAIIEGKTKIGNDCRIGAYVHLANARLADGVTVDSFSVIRDSRVQSGAVVGPFAHLRGETEVGSSVRIGSFVELKKTVVGSQSIAAHLSYLGDATIGEGVNVGAGAITCNFDGAKKHDTIIEDGAFIGSDSQLVAPVRVGKNAVVAAGSTVTEDVPEEALAIARSRQTNKAGWTKKG